MGVALPALTFTVTACRRPKLFRQMLESFLASCADPELIGRWLCIDDGSCESELQAMRAVCPELEILTTSPQDRGQHRALARLWREVRTPLVFHCEDDWRFDEPFRLSELYRELGDDDQLVLQSNPRAVGAEFNPRHPLIEGELESIARTLGFETRPKEDRGWFWPGFSLNPSLLRLDRLLRLVPDVPDGPHFEFELALRLFEAGFRSRHVAFAVTHLGDLPVSVLVGAPRPTDMRDLADRMIDGCARRPARALELASFLDHEALDTWTSCRAMHAEATAWWYVDREAGRRVLRRMWERFHASGFLFDLTVAKLLHFYGETWETLLGLVEPIGDLEHDLSRPVAGRSSLRMQKRRAAHPERFPPPVDLPRSRPNAEITLVVTSCRRLELFVRTVNAFLTCCTDHHRIGRWICIDDGSSEGDRRVMEERFPFFEFVWKAPEDRGHARSLQIAGERVVSPYVFLLEDDQELFVPSDYVSRCLTGLSVGTSIGQCLLNVNYAETLEDYDVEGGMPFQHDGLAFVAHLFDPRRELVTGRSNCHWPHFSLRPGLTRTEVWDVGFADVPFFERDFAQRSTERGWRTVFLPDIHHRHIGRLVGAAGDNAYSLNRVPQF